jgi:hypothetical protein
MNDARAKQINKAAGRFSFRPAAFYSGWQLGTTKK